MTHGRVGKWHVKRVDCKRRLSARVPHVWGTHQTDNRPLIHVSTALCHMSNRYAGQWSVVAVMGTVMVAVMGTVIVTFMATVMATVTRASESVS
jgi:hypothetical protein